jgi:hypothetical protein
MASVKAHKVSVSLEVDYLISLLINSFVFDIPKVFHTIVQCLFIIITI